LVEVMAQCFLGAILIFLITLVWAWLSDVLEKRHVTGWRFCLTLLNCRWPVFVHTAVEGQDCYIIYI